ncbi:MAG: DNA polymerase ligase N-terminal domain-containing protein, partial [Terriglobia bacterium]
EYGRKRRFDETPEPKPGPPRRTAGSRFVVQKHDATRLHYDFRLEIDGVLKSWAVPKGPSLNPADKRLAMETEDHPLEYADFEGVIPEGHYGAGSVIVWDQGTFTPEGSTPPAKQLAGGELKFVLNGKKLRGGYALVRMRRNGKGKPWLLIKHRDEATDSDWDINAHGDSAISGRSLRQVEHGLPASSPRASGAPNEPEGARKTKMPASVSPMLATLVDQPFSDPDWLFEIKWDGVRSLAWIQNGRVELHSRTGRAITAQYPELKTLPSRIDAKTAILDGEIVTLDEKGISRFERLQSRINVREASLSLRERIPVTYCIFDLLYCDGYDLRNTPLLERKTKLKNLLRQDERFVYADHQREKGREFFAVARENGLEGIVGKEIHSRYATTRSRDWVKCKITREVDVVIGGY